MLNPTEEQLADPKWWDETAPRGATNYWLGRRYFYWYKVDGDCVYFYVAKISAWSKSIHNKSDLDNGSVKRPVFNNKWRGPEDGLPPAGMECEYRLKEDDPDDWFRCRIEYKSDSGVVASCALPIIGIIEQYLTPICAEFRPIRTPEQIAADEREKAIEEMLKIYTAGASGHIGGIRALYDSGFRKLTRERLVDLTKDEPAADAILAGYNVERGI